MLFELIAPNPRMVRNDKNSLGNSIFHRIVGDGGSAIDIKLKKNESSINCYE